MADLAIGFSKTVVEVLANKVKEAIKEEAEQWEIVKRDLVFITGEFEMMQSFLDVADEERVRNNVVRTWVRQVRDLSYDVEDCIELVIHLDGKRSWRLRLWNKVQSWNCMTEPPIRPIDQAVAEIKQLKARVEDVSQRNMRYSLISDSGSKPSMQHGQAPPRSLVNAAAADMFVEEREAARKNRGLVDLTMLITGNDRDLQVISVWGTGGDLGMTSIIKDAYEEDGVCQNFRFRAWVKLAHPFNPQKFIRTLGAQFCTNSGQGRHVSPGDLGEEFVRQNNSRKYLVVLEDVCSMAEWHAIRTYLPDLHKGSRIIVSTRQLEIARLCTGRPYQVSELRKFSPDHSVCVFYKKISPEDPKGPQHVGLGGIGSDSLREKATSWKDDNSFLGRDSEAAKLFSLMKNRSGPRDKPHVVSVWGVVGVGKSTLVRSVYCDCMVEVSFDCFGWVDVCHPFNLATFSRRMLLSMRPESAQAADHIEECHNILQTHRCLVVIDGLQSNEDWDFIKDNLIREAFGSCVVIVTTDESVAAHCAVTGKSEAFHIKGLKVDAAVQHFKKVLKYNNPYAWNWSIIKQVQTLFSSKCGGFPAVLFSLCRYLATRPTDKQEHACRLLKASFIHELETNPEFCSLRGLLAWMHSYFHACSRSLKLCILYISIFPKNSLTRRSRLVRRWIAEGYTKGSDINTMVRYVEELFDKLAALSMISQSTQERTTRSGCQINGFFREYIISRSMDEKVFFPLEISVLEGECCPTIERVGQHLAIGDSWQRDKVVFDSLDFSRLRSLTVYGGWKSFFISPTMRVLRVLDLEDAKGIDNKVLEKIGEVLHRLKFLSVRGCKEIDKLPNSFGSLKQLQTLDIRRTHVVTLPPSIMKLRKLQYIRAGTVPLEDEEPSTESWNILATSRSRFGPSHTGVVVPRGIRKMKELHTLGVVNISDRCDCIMKDVKSLSQLRRLGVFGINERNIEEFSSAIVDHCYLESLSAWGEKMPQGISSLCNLEKLTLGMITVLTQLDIEILEGLKRLQTLCLRVKKVEDDVLNFFVRLMGISSKVPFGEMKVLKIACKSSVHIEFGEGAMAKLELLKVDYSYGSSLEFLGIQNTVSLKQVLHKGSCEGEHAKRLKDQVDKHPNNPIFEEDQ